MNARTTAPAVAATAALALLATGCGTEVRPAGNDISSVVRTTIPTPSTDSANCAVSALEAHAERGPVCAR